MIKGKVILRNKLYGEWTVYGNQHKRGIYEIGIHDFETLIVTGILINITSSNDKIFIVARSIAQGKLAGIVGALAIGTGNIVHTLLAAVGLLTIIINSHPYSFLLNIMAQHIRRIYWH